MIMPAPVWRLVHYGPPRKVGPGVIGTIIQTLVGTKPVSKKAILARLQKKFKDKAPEGMWSTINIQVPNRIKTEKLLTIDKDDKGYWIDPKKNGKRLKELGISAE